MYKKVETPQQMRPTRIAAFRGDNSSNPHQRRVNLDDLSNLLTVFKVIFVWGDLRVTLSIIPPTEIFLQPEWHGIKGIVRSGSGDAQPRAKRGRDGSMNRPLLDTQGGRPGGASLPRNLELFPQSLLSERSLARSGNGPGDLFCGKNLALKTKSSDNSRPG